jgi:hypothetical protein
LGCAAGAFVSWTHSAVEFAGGLLLLVSPHAEFVLIFFSQFSITSRDARATRTFKEFSKKEFEDPVHFPSNFLFIPSHSSHLLSQKHYYNIIHTPLRIPFSLK